MSWGIDDIDLTVFEKYACMFSEDGDAAFFFLVVAVHDSFWDFFVVAKDVGLSQEAVEQSSFAMVDVGDDGDIANIFWGVHREAFVRSSIVPEDPNKKKVRLHLAGNEQMQTGGGV